MPKKSKTKNKTEKKRKVKVAPYNFLALVKKKENL